MSRLRVPDSISISIGFAAGAGIVGMAGMTLNAAAGAGRGERDKAERDRVELGRDRLEPGKAEPGKVEPGNAEPDRAEPDRAELGKAAGSAAPGKAAGSAEPGRVELVTIGVPSSKSSRPRPWMVRS